MNLKKLFLLGLIYMISSSGAFATKLPDSLVQYVQKQVPNASIRFDGLITLPDGTLYLPVIPAKPDKEAKGYVASTYPLKKHLSQKPDVILFDTNFALLKVIKNNNGKPSVTNPDNIPFVVKTGVFPQDMLVPPGLIMPDELKILLGNLQIPLSSSAVNNFLNERPKQAPVKSQIFSVNPALANKNILATTLDSNLINIIPTYSSAAKFTVNLDSLPKFMEPVENGKYLLIATCGKTYLDVADLKLAVLAKKIDLAYQPSEIVLNADKTKAYVSVVDDQSIFLIDLKTMAVIEKIKIKGYPKNLAIDERCSVITYSDKTTGDVYVLYIHSEGYENRMVANSSNVSKLIPTGNLIYALSRTKNELQVIDIKLQDYIYNQPVSPKPVDMFIHNKRIYVLSACNEVSIFNMSNYEIEKVIKLDTKGFSKQFVRVPGSNIVLITNAFDKKYFVFDLQKNEVIQTVPVEIFINNAKLLGATIK